VEHIGLSSHWLDKACMQNVSCKSSFVGEGDGNKIFGPRESDIAISGPRESDIAISVQ
jgi:hypothetical protein